MTDELKPIVMPIIKMEMPDIKKLFEGTSEGPALMAGIIKHIRQMAPEAIAKSIVDVDPQMNSGEIIKRLFESAKSEEELRREGYRPVSHHGLMWVKDEPEDGK